MALERVDPYQAFNFWVQIDGLHRAGFKTCSGLDTITGVTKYREGNDASLTQRQLPGLVSYTNITLARGISADRYLLDWRLRITKGFMLRKNVSIILRDDAGNDKIQWDLRDCWPSKWAGPTFDATTDAVAIETLELVHEGVEIHKWT
jgi:phage tail-like protein